MYSLENYLKVERSQNAILIQNLKLICQCFCTNVYVSTEKVAPSSYRDIEDMGRHKCIEGTASLSPNHEPSRRY